MDARPFYLACTTHLELSADNEEEGYTMALVEFSEIRSVGSGPEGITLTLLSDYEHKATADYGIAYESFLPAKNLIMGGVPKRSAFVIDKAGVVQYAEVLEVPSDMPNFNAIQECLKSL